MTAGDSQPQTEVQLIKHIKIPLPDGAYLAADLVMPKAPGRFPAVFDYYPYRKDDITAAGLRYQHYLARHGYAALRVDVRGTGGSPGLAVDEYTPQEQQDALAAIDWMSRQPWCNGNVGMFGTSYGGFNSLQVAMHRPPALKAICPMYFTDNRYTDDCHYKGGALQMLYDLASYGLAMVVENVLPPDPVGAGEQWADIWEQRFQNEPWLLTWLENQVHSDYWRQGSLCEAYEAIQCAVFLIGGWRDGYTNCNLRTFQHLHCPKKLLIGPWLHAFPDVGLPGPRIDHVHEMVRFFDYWLKGINNGVMDEPPLTLYVQEYDVPAANRSHTSGFWRHESGWPLDRTRTVSLYLAGSGRLGPEPESRDETVSYHYHPGVGVTFGMFSASAPYLLPLDQRSEEAFSLNWTSEPLTEPLEILGYPETVLHLAVSTTVATVVARLSDVAPDGTSAFITKGVLNLTHRESHAQPSSLVPGQVYQVTVPLDATSWRFQPGHRLRLSLAGADFPNTWPSPHLYAGTVHLGQAAPSRLVLPVVALQEPALPAPRLQEPALLAPTAEVQAGPPTWRITRDAMAGTSEVYLSSASHTWVKAGLEFSSSSEATATVSEQDPARAAIRGSSRVTLYRLGSAIDTQASGQIESSEDAFHVVISLNIIVDDKVYHTRRWARSIPRHLL